MLMTKARLSQVHLASIMVSNRSASTQLTRIRAKK